MNAFFDWLLESGWQATLLIPLILAVQWALRNRWTPEWRAALWWLMVVRLCLPWVPESSLSLFNWVPKSAPVALGAIGNGWQQNSSSALAVSHGITDEASARKIDKISWDIETRVLPGEEGTVVQRPEESHVAESVGEVSFLQSTSQQSQAGIDKSWEWKNLALGIWVVGCALYWVWIGIGVLRIRRIKRSGYSLSGSKWGGVMQECMEVTSLKQAPELRVSREVQSPMLVGARCPVILISESVVHHFSREELRHVVLHEAAHVVRKDIWVNWLNAVALSLHWWNPMLWWAFGRMRQDQELAADSLALKWSGVGSEREYGATLIKVFEARNGNMGLIPDVVGVGGTMRQMRKRVREISKKEENTMSKYFGVLVGGVFSAIAVTSPISSIVPDEVKAEVIRGEPDQFTELDTVAVEKTENSSKVDPLVELRERLNQKFDSEEKLYGRVVDAQGNPVEGAELGFKEPDSTMVFTADNRFKNYNVRIHTFSEEGGKFRFDYFSGKYLKMAVEEYLENRFSILGKDKIIYPNIIKSPAAIYVIHEVGFKIVLAEDYEFGTDIVLEPWANVSGRVVLNNSLGKVKKVLLNSSFGNPAYPALDRYRFGDFDALEIQQTGGLIEFNKRLPDGLFNLSILENSDSGMSHSMNINIQLAPGEIHDVNIRDEGLTIVGKFCLEGTAENFDPKNPNNRISAAMFDQRMLDYWGKHRNHELYEIRDYMVQHNDSIAKNQRRSHLSQIDESGNFSFKYLLPGYYLIQISTFPRPERYFYDSDKKLLILKILEPEPQNSSKEYDIGEFILTEEGVDVSNVKYLL